MTFSKLNGAQLASPTPPFALQMLERSNHADNEHSCPFLLRQFLGSGGGAWNETGSNAVAEPGGS